MQPADFGKTEQFRTLARSMFFSNETIDWADDAFSGDQIGCIAKLIRHELDVRARNKRDKLFRRAKFPSIKSFEGYDFSNIVLPEGYGVDDLKSLGFIDKAQGFVFYGQTGRGKTHLAIAIGAAAIAAGRTVQFFTAAQLALALSRASREGTLEALLKDIQRNDLLILDEFGYVPLDIESARLVFQVASNCYEKRSVIFTTNIEFSRWGTVLGDDKLAAALIDRVVHHSRLVEFEGPSRRMDCALMLGKGDAR